MPANVKFIIGRSGSGKSSEVYALVKANERAGVPTYLIVPDRETYAVERSLSEALGGGLFHTSVLSFTRLAHRVLNETGRGLSFLSAQGRQMLTRRIIDENLKKLSAFARVGRRHGFAKECDRTVAMFKRFDITPEQLTSAEGLDEHLKSKLDDFALIYSKLIERMHKRYIDDEDLMNSLILRLKDSSVRGADVFIDAPDMLTEQRLRITETLFAVAKNVVITLRADKKSGENGEIFAPDIEAYMRLNEMASRCGCRILPAVHLEGDRRHKDAALRRLGEVLFSYTAKPFIEKADSIEIHSSPDVLSEVRDTAGMILAEIKAAQEKGEELRFRDIAVAVCDMENYREPVRRIFGAYGIPFFMDSKLPVDSHPVAELVLAALACAQNNFRANDFIRVLKTGLCGLKPSEVERLENHIVTFGLNGKRLCSDEPSVRLNDPADVPFFESVEASRKAVAGPLVRLRDNLAAEDERTAATRVAALYAYLEELSVADKIKAWSKRLESDESDAMNAVYASLNRQVYDKVIELFDQIHLIIGDEPIGLTRFASVVREGLESYEIGLIPPKLDQVLVADAGSQHMPEVRRLFILGAIESSFPPAKQDNAIINDRDLALMRLCGINAWDSTERLFSAARLSLYTLINRPTEKLTLCYPRSIGGSAAERSRLVRSIEKQFPQHISSASTAASVDMSAKPLALDTLAGRVRDFIETGREDDSLAPLYASLHADDAYRRDVEKLEKLVGGGSKKLSLGSDTAKRLYGDDMRGSVSRLQQFNECPYHFLLNYGLKVTELREYELRSDVRGTILHDALERIMRTLIEENKAHKQADNTQGGAENAYYKALTMQDLHDKFDTMLDEHLDEANHGMLEDSAAMRTTKSKLKELIYDTAYAAVRQIALGSFSPYAVEYTFGAKDTEGDVPAPEFVLEGGDKIKFRMVGKIDRVDTYAGEDGKQYFRIIDYKSSKRSFDYTELENGISIQLPIYAEALRTVMGETDAAPSGMYYFGMQEPVVNEASKRDDDSLGKMRLVGPTLLNRDIINATEEGLLTGNNHSKVVSSLRASTNKKEYPSGFSSGQVLSESDMEKVINTAKARASKALKGIASGDAAVSPYRISHQKHACMYCPYISICRFDATAGHRSRSLKRVTSSDFFGHDLLSSAIDKTDKKDGVQDNG